MDPVLISVAAAVAGKATEELARGVRAAAELVRRRFAGDAEEVEVLERVERGDAPVEDLAAAIERACEADPQLRKTLEASVGRPIQVVKGSMFHNEFHGDGPKNVVQADTIHNLRLD